MRVGEVVSSIIIGSIEVVGVGILLCIGFHIGGKIIEKIESKSSQPKKRLAKA